MCFLVDEIRRNRMSVNAGDVGFVSLDVWSVQCASDQILRFKKQLAVAMFCVLNVGLCFLSVGFAINLIARVTAVCDKRLKPLMMRLDLCLNAKLVTIG